MKKGVWMALALGLGAVLTWNGYQMAGPNEALDVRAREIACRALATCDDATSFETEVNAFRRRYTWDTSSGVVVVDCRRPYVLLGTPTCSADRKALGPMKPKGPRRNPHELERGQVR